MELTSRTEQVETLLNTHDQPLRTPEEIVPDFGVGTDNSQSATNLDETVAGLDVAICDYSPRQWPFKGDGSKKTDAPHASQLPHAPMEDIVFDPDVGMNLGLDDNMFNWEMIGLGLDEPLPPQDTIDEL